MTHDQVHEILRTYRQTVDTPTEDLINTLRRRNSELEYALNKLQADFEHALTQLKI
jgi:hypothetical protein